MELHELQADYLASAALLRKRLAQLRQEMAAAQTADERCRLRRRITELTPMLPQMNELAELVAHYYDRGYWRSEKYCL